MPDAAPDSVPDAANDLGTIALARETARIGVRRAGAHRVVVRTETREEQQTLSADLEAVRVEVSRVVVGRDVDAVPDVRVEGDVTILPVMEERVVVTRQLVLKEEIHVRRVTERRRTEVPVTLRHEVAVIERIDARTGQMTGQILSQETSTGGNEP
jgi:stress response protein YsnF